MAKLIDANRKNIYDQNIDIGFISLKGHMIELNLEDFWKYYIFLVKCLITLLFYDFFITKYKVTLNKLIFILKICETNEKCLVV